MNAASLLILAVLYIPQSNDETLSQAPLDAGQTCFIMRDGSATLKVGGADVIDRSALRGYRVKTLDRSAFVVSVDGGFTYSGANDEWTKASSGSTGLTNHVTIRAASPILSVDSLIKYGSIGEIFPDISLKISDKTATYTVVWPTNAPNCSIGEISVSTCTFGDADAVTDLTTDIFQVKDSVGTLPLGEWRSWAKSLYNGNRGEDWSKYSAVNNVDMAGYSFAFDSKAHYTQGLDTDTNLVVTAGGYRAVVVSHHGTTISPSGALNITHFSVTNLTCYIGYTHDISGFDLTGLKVFQAFTLEKPITWTEVPSGDILSKTASMIVVAPQSGLTQRFLKLVYNGSVETEIVSITMSGFVNIVGDLSINNTNLTAWMRQETASRKLSGKTFDFATMKGVYEAVSNVVYELGGTIENFPAFNQ